jgi:phosphoglycolate phosphatase
MAALHDAIFDLDGTLIDSLPGIGWSIEAALAACGLAPRSFDLKPLIGPPIRAMMATISGVSDAPALDCLERAFRASYDSEGWRKTVCQPGAPAALAELRTRGIALWVVTNKPRLSTGMILHELALESFFTETVCRDSRTPPFASKAEMLSDLLRRRNLERSRSLLIGDTSEDAHAASEAGVPCALVPHGYGGGLDATLPEGCLLLAGWSHLLDLFHSGENAVGESHDRP